MKSEARTIRQASQNPVRDTFNLQLFLIGILARFRLTDIGVTRIVFLTGRWRDLDVQLQNALYVIFQAKKHKKHEIKTPFLPDRG